MGTKEITRDSWKMMQCLTLAVIGRLYESNRLLWVKDVVLLRCPGERYI